jgi:hypothetical protein
LFLAAAGLRGARPALLRQVHGARVLEVERIAAVGGGGLEADAVVAHAAAGPRGLAPAVRWADCVPVLLAEQDGRAVAAVHSGWRGTAARVVPRAVARLAERGVAPEALVAAIGPSIGPCCYEVGDEVADAVARASGGMTARVVSGRPGRRRLDLREAIRLQLEGEGVGAGSIHVAPWCTACSADLFFSYRRQGAAAGRQMACIGWPPGGPP